MHNTPIRQTLVALALAAVSLTANAHRPWLLAQMNHVEAKEPWVVIDGAISDDLFEIDHLALKLDGATVTGPDGVVMPIPAPLVGRQRSSFDLKMPKDGTYKVSLVTSTVVASYKDKASGEIKRFRGSEEAFAKEVPAGADELRATTMHARLETFATANRQSTGAFKPSGVGLEMIPVTHPTDLRAGEKATWRFTLDGKPLANHPFSLIPGGVRYRGVIGEIRLSTDAKGEATVTLPAAGMVWLNASYPLNPPAPGEGPAISRRYSYAGTLAILPD
jgi:uncharacterized GH25 family protein